MFALGIGAQTILAVSGQLILLGLIISFGVAVVWRRNQLMTSAPYLLLGSVLLCSFCVGLLRTEVASWQFGVSPLQTQVGEGISFTGTVVVEPKQSANSTKLYISDSVDTLFVSADRHSSVEYGDVVTVSGTLAEPQSFTTELGRTFDYPGYLKAKGVEYTISFAAVELRETGQGNTVLASLLSLKHAFMSRLEQVIPEPQVGLGEGLLLGVKQALGEDIENNFRRTGIIHIVVLSGYNVMLVVTFFMLVFSFFLSPRKRVVAGIIAIVCFALLVGLSATVVRASIMASLLLFAQGFSRQYDVLRALFFAGAIMLLLNPYLLIYDIGFQLSFMATLGLLLITPHFESTIVTSASSLRVTDFFYATLATQIAVLPLLLYHIGEVSIVAIVVNVLVLPVVPIAMLLTFITGMIAFVSLSLAAGVGFLANISLIYILFMAEGFAKLPFAAVEIPEFSATGVLVLYGVIAGALFYARKRLLPPPLPGWTVEEESENPVAFSGEKTTGLKRETLPKIFR
jgi:competence protein ComEC